MTDYAAGSLPSGAEADVLAACGIARIPGSVPHAMLGGAVYVDAAGRVYEPGAPVEEHRADASTTGPAAGARPATLRIFPAVYARSVLAPLGVMLRTTRVGDAARPTITTGAAANAVAAGAARDAAAVVLTPNTANPHRVQARIRWRLEDAAASGPEYETALRTNLMAALANAVSNEALNGDGTAGALNGIAAQLEAADAPTAVVTYASFAASVGGLVDGQYADRLGDITLLVNSATYSKLAGELATGTAATAASYGEMMLRRLMASSLAAAGTAAARKAVAFRYRADLMQAEPAAELASWDYSMLTRDRYSDIATGELSLTAIALVGSKVQLTQPSAYRELRYQTA